VVNVFAVLEELVILRMGKQLGSGVLLTFEYEPGADTVNVEAIVNDCRQFDLESVVVYRLVTSNVNL
jgi:hypothetical protein